MFHIANLISQQEIPQSQPPSQTLKEMGLHPPPAPPWSVETWVAAGMETDDREHQKVVKPERSTGSLEGKRLVGAIPTSRATVTPGCQSPAPPGSYPARTPVLSRCLEERPGGGVGGGQENQGTEPESLVRVSSNYQSTDSSAACWVHFHSLLFTWVLSREFFAAVPPPGAFPGKLCAFLRAAVKSFRLDFQGLGIL